MLFKKDNFWLGVVIGVLAPVLGLLIFKFTKMSIFSFKETFQFLMYEPGYRTLSVSLSLSLLLNALFFTLYLNQHKDKTAKGIFAVTVIYGLLVLVIKTFA
ncbi:MAG TPA: hypothetical protein PKC39_14255 [Ferruginibacter sp.]|nr:hypothetical protein [Ferruginibacter sp.]HMP22117.1 hypothetical protein [Ferruginibacter sp.]